MNTRKQVMIMSALMLLSMLVLGAYAAWYPSRETAAAVNYEEKGATRGAATFAQNCRLCHGDVAEGGALGGRLAAAPALDRPDLQGYLDSGVLVANAQTSSDSTLVVKDAAKFKVGQTILVSAEKMLVKGIDGNTLKVERGVPHGEAATDHAADAAVLILDPAALKDKVSLITNTITCGRIGTPMPAWAQTQSGPLSDEQIRQLMVLITTGRWELVREDDDKIDLLKTKLLTDVTEGDGFLRVSDVTVFNANDAIRIDDERIRVKSILDHDGKKFDPKSTDKDKSGLLIVDRAIYKTTPLPHTADEPVLKFPETATPAINAAACGQTAKPAVVTEPKLIECDDCQKVDQVASGISFSAKTITVSSTTSKQVRVRLDNQDKDTQHNISFYKSKTETTGAGVISVGVTITGPAMNDSLFDVPAKGSYFFRCDVHPDLMQGTLTVN
jgi:hypothetical protein